MNHSVFVDTISTENLSQGNSWEKFQIPRGHFKLSSNYFETKTVYFDIVDVLVILEKHYTHKILHR